MVKYFLFTGQIKQNRHVLNPKKSLKQTFWSVRSYKNRKIIGFYVGANGVFLGKLIYKKKMKVVL